MIVTRSNERMSSASVMLESRIVHGVFDRDRLSAQLYTQSERRRHELKPLHRADETLLSSLRLDDVLRSLADVATDVLNADKISVAIWDPERQ